MATASELMWMVDFDFVLFIACPENLKNYVIKFATPNIQST
jgi:hypothetical protein